MRRQNIRTLSLVIITLTYLIIGAALFDFMESPHEQAQLKKFNETLILLRHMYNMNETVVKRVWELAIEKKPYSAGNQWKFMGSLYFCTVVITLIGYGHSTPRTLMGKFFCILYSLVGIPIALIMFQSVGERLNTCIAYIFCKLKQKFQLRKQEVTIFDLITVEFALTITITCMASYVFVQVEQWSYFDSMYYCFITLTTIGFGDYVPMQTNQMLNKNPFYTCANIFFILTGLTTLASSMNLLVLRLATINAEEQVQERLEQAEAQRQAVRLDGDVISPNQRLLATTQEKPEQQVDNISICSCTCIDSRIWQSQRATCKRNTIKLKRLNNANDTQVTLNTTKRMSTSNLSLSTQQQQQQQVPARSYQRINTTLNKRGSI